VTTRIISLSLALAATLLVALVIRVPLTAVIPAPSAPRAVSTIMADATSTTSSMPAIPTPSFVLPSVVLTPEALDHLDIQTAINLKRELNHEPDAFGPNAGRPIALPASVATSVAASSRRLALLPVPTPSPSVCGSWAAVSGAVGSVITAHFGEIRNCGLYGTQWVITALGQRPASAEAGKASSGVIAVYQCTTSDAGCLDGQTPHGVDGWQFFLPPSVGGVTVLGLSPSGSGNLLIDNAGGQMCFNLKTHAYDTTDATC